MKLLLLTGLAGLLGTLLRFGCVQLVNRYAGNALPWGTLAVNTAGAFIAGFAAVWCRTKFPQYAAWMPVLFVGFLGAFTTFSTFALESSLLLTQAKYGRFALNVILQNGTGLGAALLGLTAAKHLI